MHSIYFLVLFTFICNSKSLLAQKSNKFPEKADPLYVKVELLNELMLANNWNEGTFMHGVIYPPTSLDRTVIGRFADSMDETTNMLVAYSNKYFVTKNPEDRNVANQIFEGLLNMETVTRVPGLLASGFYKTKEQL